MKVAVVKETGPAERRVALVPEAIAKLRSAGHEVLVERGAGDAAFFPDDAFADAGATIVSVDPNPRDASKKSRIDIFGGPVS